MGISIVKYTRIAADTAEWGILNDGVINPLQLGAKNHKDLMAAWFGDRDGFGKAVSDEAVNPGDVRFLAPLSNDIQLFAQGLNYADHRAESGVEADISSDDEDNLIFYKAASSICGPNDDIIRPKGCELLDYEIELGLVLKADIADAITIRDADLPKYVGGLVLCNDVSARDMMFGAGMIQWFKGKSQRTFCPTGPVLYLLDDADFANLDQLNLELKMNGKVKQHASTSQLIHKPAKTLGDIAAFADIRAGDCILTGTPGGILAGHSLKAGLAILLNFTNDKKRRAKFVKAQKAQTTFLQPGDVLELSITSDDGSINLGQQRNVIADA